MMNNEIRSIVESAWNERELLKDPKVQHAIRSVIKALDEGTLRIAEPVTDDWITHEWIKKAVILYFPVQNMETTMAGPFEYHDKIPLKTDYEALGVRVVPPAVARYGSFIGKGVILMPSYVNIGAYID